MKEKLDRTEKLPSSRPWSLIPSHHSYNGKHQDCLALELAVLLLLTYLKGDKLTVPSDQVGLEWIPGLTDAKRRLECWRHRSYALHYYDLYRAYIENQTPGTLSTLETAETDITKVDNDLPEIMISLFEQQGEMINDDWHTFKVAISYGTCTVLWLPDSSFHFFVLSILQRIFFFLPWFFLPCIAPGQNLKAR